MKNRKKERKALQKAINEHQGHVLTSSVGEKDVRCSFCGKTQDEVKELIAGPEGAICDECVGLCVDIMREQGVKFE